MSDVATSSADAFERAAAHIADAQRIAVLTGAGISTAAGIPDFRGPNGLWTKNPQAERASNINNYREDPEIRRWAWQRRVELAEVVPLPTAAHRALVRLEQRGVLLALATQNIDGLHHEAGSDPSLVHEVHGTNRLSHCMSCGREWPTPVLLDRVRAGEPDPPCTDCGGIVKPAVVYFGEPLPQGALHASFAAAQGCDLLLAIGTTLGVYPIRHMVSMASDAGAAVVIVNGGPTEMDAYADVRVGGDIEQVLPALLAG